MVELDIPSLRQIFSYLNFADQRNVELVCRLWRQVSLTSKLAPFTLKIYFEPHLQISHRGLATVEFSGKVLHRKFPSNTDETNIVVDNENFVEFLNKLLTDYGMDIVGVYLGGVKNERNTMYPVDYDMYSDVRAEILPNLLQLVLDNCKNLRKFRLKMTKLHSGCLPLLSAVGLGSVVKEMCFHNVSWHFDPIEMLIWQENIPSCTKFGFGSTTTYLLNSMAEGLINKEEYLDELHIYGRTFDFLVFERPDTNFYSIFNRTLRISCVLDIGDFKLQPTVATAMCEMFQFANITRLELLIVHGPASTDLFDALKCLKDKLVDLKLRSYENETTERHQCILTNNSFDILMNILATCTKLSSLYLCKICRGVNDFQPISNVNNLESFGLDSADGFTEQDLIFFVSQNENLKRLTVMNCPLINGFVLMRTLNYTVNLIALQVFYCGPLKNGLAYRLVEKCCPTLEYCHLKGHLYWSTSARDKVTNVVPFVEYYKKHEVKMILDENVMKKWQNAPHYLIPSFDDCEFCGVKLSR